MIPSASSWKNLPRAGHFKRWNLSLPEISHLDRVSLLVAPGDGAAVVAAPPVAAAAAAQQLLQLLLQLRQLVLLLLQPVVHLLPLVGHAHALLNILRCGADIPTQNSAHLFLSPAMSAIWLFFRSTYEYNKGNNTKKPILSFCSLAIFFKLQKKHHEILLNG